MGTLYLHIGTPKTGTSMIQRFLGRNQEVLESNGYRFPDFGFTFEGIGKNRNAYFMTCKIYDDKKMRDIDAEDIIRKKGYAQLLKELEQYENVILTDEHIWNGYLAVENFWENLYQKIVGAGHELKVIVYLRRQDKFIQSYWAQKVKEYIRISFDRYIEEERYVGCQLDYDKVLDDISKVIGKDRIIVRAYETVQYQGTDQSLVSDFLYTIGLGLTEEYDNSLQSVNVALKGGCLEVKRFLNHLPEYRQGKSFIVPYLYEVAQQDEEDDDYKTLACFAEGQLENFMGKFQEGNARVASVYMEKENGILFEEKIDYSVREKQEYGKKDMMETCGKVLLAMQERIDDLEKENRLCKAKLQGYKRCSVKSVWSKTKALLKH